MTKTIWLPRLAVLALATGVAGATWAEPADTNAIEPATALMASDIAEAPADTDVSSSLPAEPLAPAPDFKATPAEVTVSGSMVSASVPAGETMANGAMDEEAPMGNTAPMSEPMADQPLDATTDTVNQ